MGALLMGHQETFGTDNSNIARNNTVYVESINGFPDPVAGVITLVSGINYRFTKPINIGTIEFVIPDNGLVQFSTTNVTNNFLTTEISGSQVLFSGNITRLHIEQLNMTSINGGIWADLSNATGPGFVFLDQATMTGFDSLGSIEGCSFSTENVGGVSNGAGLTLNNMFFIVMREWAFAAITGNHIILTGTLIGAIFEDLIMTPSSGDAFIKIDPGLTIANRILVIDNLFSDAAGGTLFDPTGLDQTDPKVIAFNNNSPDSNWIGSTGFTGGTTETVFADTSTFVKVAGTYVDGELEGFTSSGGVLTCVKAPPKALRITTMVAPLVEPGIETDVVQVSLHKNGVEVPSTRRQKALTTVFQTPTTPTFDDVDNVTVVIGDTLEIRWRNTSNATNIAATDAKLVVG